MTDTMQLSTMERALGASRPDTRIRPSMDWSIGAVSSALKSCTHRVSQDFGTNATYHPRPEEAPL